MDHTICIFGDSITWGASDPEKGGWAQRLKSHLETHGHEDGFYLYPLGIPGDTSETLLDRFLTEARVRRPDTIVFAIGVNDAQYIGTRDNPKVSLTVFRKNLLELIKQAKTLHSAIVFVGLTCVDEAKTLPVPWSGGQFFFENALIQKYDQILQDLSAEHELPYIPVFDLLKKSDFEDGLHPNAQGHEKIFNQILKFFTKEIQ